MATSPGSGDPATSPNEADALAGEIAVRPTRARQTGKAATLRARVRAEMTEEIKQTARRHLAAEGAPNLSLRAVARDVGLVSSAVYRYFPSRDDLLTALIMDAYNALGEATEVAERAVDRSDLIGRHSVTSHAVRAWALAHPHEYALTYGSPVPGYVAPNDTVGPASRVPVVLLSIVVDGVSAGIVRPAPGDWLSPLVRQEMVDIAARTHPGIPPTVMARAMFVWSSLFGTINFEVFGRLDTIIESRDAWFEHEVLVMARLLGLRP
jgi:AcrR family transcriptional regulator